jgi:predicted metal-binding membrane protein
VIRTAPAQPDGSIRLVLAVVASAVLGWTGMIALHGALPPDPATGALAALPPAMRQLVAFCGHAPEVAGAGLANWILGWSLMIVAMMVPPALPLLRAAQRLFDDRADGAWLLLALLGAFLATWVLAGGVLFATGTLARSALRLLPIAWQRVDLACGLAAIAAGLFQFSTLKMACMDACRSPVAVMMVRWRAAHPWRSALDIGAAYGAICVGCCWATMLLGVVVGALMLPIMVLCALFMTMERLLPVVRPLIPLQAALAVAIGALLLTGAIPPAFS